MDSNKLTVCLMYGGKSGEHDVSRRSAASVARHLDKSRYKILAIGIDRDGHWHLQSELSVESVGVDDESIIVTRSIKRVALVPMLGLHVDGQPLTIDCVFPVLHGDFGEDGRLQGALETAGLPYVGAGVLGSSAGMDKAVAKALWRDAGLPVLDFACVDAQTQKGDLEGLGHRFGWPLFVKPCCGGSSLGASRADNLAALHLAVTAALRHDQRALVEPCLDVRELECSVLGNTEVTVFPPGEIAPNSSHSFYDFEAKYKDPEGASLLTVAEIDAELQQSIMQIARAAYSAVRCEGMARVDFFVDKRSGKVFLNEINTLPGFTSISMYPRMCEAGGLAYAELLNQLIKLAMQRGGPTQGQPHQSGPHRAAIDLAPRHTGIAQPVGGS